MDLNSTFILEDDTMSFAEYMDLQSPDENTQTNSTFNNFNANITFNRYIHYGLLEEPKIEHSGFDTTDEYAVEEPSGSFTRFLLLPFTRRFYIRYDHESFYLFCNSQNYQNYFLQ